MEGSENRKEMDLFLFKRNICMMRPSEAQQLQIAEYFCFVLTALMKMLHGLVMPQGFSRAKSCTTLFDKFR